MNFNFDEIVIDRPIRAHMFDLNGKRRWTATQMRDATLECAGETVYSTDAQGVNIMAFERSKNATFGFSNALMHLGVMADQIGAEKKVAAAGKAEIMHCFEFAAVTVAEGAATVTLAHTPYAEVEGVPFKYVDKVGGDGATIATYELGSSAATNFSVEGNVITLPTGADFADGDRIAVKYKYETTEGAAMDNVADSFSDIGEFMVEVLAYNPCDRSTKVALNIVFPNAKTSNNVSLTMNNELTHPVSISAMPDYCSATKKLFRVEMHGE